MFWPRTLAGTAVRRPSVWIIVVLWWLVKSMSNPPRVDPIDPLGSWWSNGLNTPGWFALELTVFHLIIVTDVLLAARNSGLLAYAPIAVGQRGWLASVVIAAAIGAVLHVAAWCVVTGYTAVNDGAGWSPAADPDWRLPGDQSGFPTMVVILVSAVFSLTLVSLLVAAAVHAISSTTAVIVLVGAWCAIEIPLTFAELGLQIARTLDPADVIGPGAVLHAAERPWRVLPLLAVFLAWSAAAVIAIRVRRSRAVLGAD